jgi:uncharacterized repeat protein (TIGR01451 family)
MKKGLLLLFLFLSIETYAQAPPGMYPPIKICDDATADGISTFDLTQALPIILDGLDPAIHTISFYPSDTDALNDTNMIATPNAYINSIPYTQTIGVRIVNTALNEVHLAGMEIIVNPLPIAHTASLYFCDPFELAIYYLPNANAEITNGNTSSIVTYYATLANAQAATNPLQDGYNPTHNPGTDILYARVENPETHCATITTLAVNTNNCGSTCPAPINLTASNVTDTSFSLNWTTLAGSVGYSMVCLVPQGSPPSDTGVIASTAPSPFLITGLSPNTCYSAYVKTACTPTSTSEWSEPLTICMPNCANAGSCPEALVLNAFSDLNNNNIKDSGEPNFNHGNFVYQINASDTDLYGAVNNGNYYIFDSNPANSYTLHFAVNSDLTSYFTSSYTANNITLPVGSGITYLYFPIHNVQPFEDAIVQLFPEGAPPRPGFIYTLEGYYWNQGLNTIPNGTLTFTKDPLTTISSVSILGATQTPTGFTYNFTNLEPGVYHHFTIALQIPTIPTIAIGDYIHSIIQLQTAIDANTANNTQSYNQMVVGSYDPNEKSESHGGKIGLDNFTNNDYLYYTITFENTGTANASFIRVEDTLDPRLDETTFEMLTASHTVNSKREGNQLTWHFFDINLPPTVSSPNESHGAVTFKIKPKAGFAVGDIIPNEASIYFDYNPAIVTNTCNTEFFATLSAASFSESQVNVFPNPSQSSIQISIPSSTETMAQIRICDVLGKTVKLITNLNANSMQLDVSSLEKGVYLLVVTSQSQQKIIKKLIRN